MNRSLLKALVLLVLAMAVVASDDFYLEVGRVSNGRTTEVEKFRAVRIIKLERIEQKFLYLVVSQARGDISQSIKMAVFKNQETDPMAIC